jgi:hypothetical protein
VKQQEGDIDLYTISIICVGSVDNALFAREIFLISLIIVSGCAKDDTANMEGKQDSLPEKSPPVAAPEWYPTPKQLTGRGTPAPATTTINPFDQYQQDTRPAPAAGGATPGVPTYGTQDIQWPSDQEPGKYKPWTSGQTRTQGAAEPARQALRRPWGEIEAPKASAPPPQPQPQPVWQYPGSQPAGGPGYELQSGQPRYMPGTIEPIPQDFPAFVW